MSASRTGALVRGHGPRILDVFIEPTCPFCAKAFAKLPELLQVAGPEALTQRIWLHSQPWHLFSGLLTRAILAAARQDPDGDSAIRVMATIFANRDSYEFEDHARGPNLHATPAAVLARLVEESGVDMRASFDLADLQDDIKRHTRFARQNGIHVSPSFMIDGLLDPAMGSGESVDAWLARLRLS